MKPKNLLMSLAILTVTLFYSSVVCQEKPPLHENSKKGEALNINDTYNEVTKGIRLVLAYHYKNSTFVGSIQNITDEIINSIYVKVVLSNGVEFGTKELFVLEPGEKTDIAIAAIGQPFNWWMTFVNRDFVDHGKFPEVVRVRSAKTTPEAESVHGDIKQSKSDVHMGEQSKSNIHAGKQSKSNVHQGEKSTEDVNIDKNSIK